MSSYEKDYSGDYDYVPKGMDDIGFHDEVVRSSLEYCWLQKYDDDRRAEQDAQENQEWWQINGPIIEFIEKYFPAKRADDMSECGDLYKFIEQEDGLRSRKGCI